MAPVTIAQPVHPLVDESNPYTAELERARQLFEREIDSNEGWETHGHEHHGVLLEKRGLDAGEDRKYAIPMVRGTCTIEDATTDQIFPIIQTPGIRKKWDPRFEDAWILRRFSPTCFQFYSLGNSPPKLTWLIWPRDLVGVHQAYIDGQPSDERLGQNKEIILIQTSVEDGQRAPEQSGKTRMTLFLSGWRLTPHGKDVKATYLCKVWLGGSIPKQMVSTVIVDLPKCAGKLRDTFYEYGTPPYVVHSSPSGTRSLEQSDLFHLGPSKNNVHEPLPNDKHYHLHMTGVQEGHFEIVYDIKRMYAQDGGVHITLRGEGKDGLSCVDDGQGVVYVKVHEKAHGKPFEIIVSPHGKGVVAMDS